MTKEQLRKTLLDSITEDEWIQLEQNADILSIWEFNRRVLLRMRDDQFDVRKDIPDGKIGRLYALLKDYLQKYMSECPEGHKWIYIACIYLTFVEEIPMHPQDVIKWEEKDQRYFCPVHSGSDSVCECCVCNKHKNGDG